MINKIHALIAISLFATTTSCHKSETTSPPTNDNTSISFTTDEFTTDWSLESTSRGVATEDINLLSSIMVYSFLSEPNDVTNCYIDHKAAIKGAGNVWSFDPTYYYPLSEKLDFLAYTPQAHANSESDNNGITQTLDFENKSIKINYATPIVGRNHPDLMLASPVKECDRETPLSKLSFTHALTQLSMSAMVGSSTKSDRYVITRFMLHNVATTADMTYSIDGGIGEWIPSAEGDFIASAILPDPTIDGETQVKLTDKYQSIMSNGHTLFMIPQDIESKSGTTPTIQITIYDTEEELTYRTQRLTLPSPNKEGWIAGDHVNLQFKFDVSSDDLVIPMTLEAKLLDWVEQVVDKDVNANIYAFLSDESITSGDNNITLYTNGVAIGITADGSVITSASLGAADSNGYFPITLTTTSDAVGEGFITVKIENSHEATITKTFSITVN